MKIEHGSHISRVSVVVPVYKAAELLPVSVESVISQNFQDWEMWLIDDCSPDNSYEVASSLAQRDPERIHVLKLSDNGGPSKARNKGLELAKGEFIIFLDADDAYLPGSFKRLVELADRYPDAGIISGGIIRGETMSGSMPKFEGLESKNYEIESREAMRLMFYQRPEGDHSPWGKLYRRSLFDTVRFREGVRFEDMEIYPRLLSKTDKVVVCSEKVYFYRTNPVSFINSWSPSRLDSLEVSEGILNNILSKNNRALERAARSLRLSSAFNAFFLASNHEERTIAEKAWNLIKKERFLGLTDPNVRMKNKIGILLSYGGRNFLEWFGKFGNKYR